MATSKGVRAVQPQNIKNMPNNGAVSVVTEVSVVDGKLVSEENQANPGVRV